MKFFIQIENNSPVGKPILETKKQDKIVYASFVFTPAPQLGPYETNQTVEYQNVNGQYIGVWSCRTMSLDERQQKQNLIKNTWIENNCYPSWVFDETTCSFEAPTPHPNNGKKYHWDELTTSWIEVKT
jgi:hypothetical protein